MDEAVSADFVRTRLFPDRFTGRMDDLARLGLDFLLAIWLSVALVTASRAGTAAKPLKT